jgi:type III pantothenate kinase
MIALDVGNSRIKFGLFRDLASTTDRELPQCKEFLAVSLTAAPLPWPQLEELFQRDIQQTAGTSPDFVVASVNPDGLARLLAEWPQARWAMPRVLDSALALPLINRTRNPEKVGKDRLLKAIAANVIRTPDRPLIVVDSGTAITVDWISAQGEFCGGAILPGLKTAAKAMHEYTAQLPLIDTHDFEVPPPAIGDETHSALRSGLFWGHIGAVRELIQRMATEQSQPVPAVLVTGGAGESLTRQLDRATYRPALTLEGIAVVVRQGR